MSFSANWLFANVLFSAIGMGAFIYAKNRRSLKAALFGVALMAYPYFVAQTWLLYGAGIVLTAALFIFHD